MSLNIGEYSIYAGSAEIGTLSVTQNGLMTVLRCESGAVSDEILRLAAVTERGAVPLGVMMPEGDVLRFQKSYSKNSMAQLGLQGVTGFILVTPKGPYAPEGFENQAQAAEENASDLPPLGGEEMTENPAENPAENLAEENPSLPWENTENLPEVAGENVPAPPETPAEIKAEEKDGEEAAQKPDETAAQVQGGDGWEPVSDPGALFTDRDIAAVCEQVRGAFSLKRGDLTMLAVPVRGDEPFPMMPIFCFGHNQTIAGREYVVFKIQNGKLIM